MSLWTESPVLPAKAGGSDPKNWKVELLLNLWLYIIPKLVNNYVFTNSLTSIPNPDKIVLCFFDISLTKESCPLI